MRTAWQISLSMYFTNPPYLNVKDYSCEITTSRVLYFSWILLYCVYLTHILCYFLNWIGNWNIKADLYLCNIHAHFNFLTSMHEWVLSHFSCVQFLGILWSITHRASLSGRFPRQEYWNGLPWPPLGDFPDPGIESASLTSLALAREFFNASTTWETLKII